MRLSSSRRPRIVESDTYQAPLIIVIVNRVRRVTDVWLFDRSFV